MLFRSETIAEQTPKVIPLITSLFDAFITVAITFIPRIARVGMELVLAILIAIRDKIGDITTVAIEIIVAFIDGIASKLGDVIEAGANLIVQFVQGMADAVATHGPELVAAFESLLLAVLETLVSAIPGIGKTGAKAIEEYRKSLDSGKSSATKSAKSTAEGVEKNLKVSPKVTKDLKTSMGDISKTIESEGKTATKKSKTLADDSSKNLKIKSQYSNGYNAVGGIISGMDKQIPTLRSKSNEVARIVDETIRKKNEIHSPSKLLARTGKYLMQGLINGVDSLIPQYQKSADNISTTLIASTNGAINSISVPNMDLTSIITRSSEVSLRMSSVERENQRLTASLASLTKELGFVTESMNSRTLNSYVTVDGTADPEAFADGLLRSFKLNARTV